MKEIKVYCDKCKKEFLGNVNELNFSLKIDRRMDTAGSMEDIYFQGDYCVSCLIKALQLYLKDKPFEEARNIIKLLKV